MDIDLSMDAPVAENLQEANDTISALWSLVQNLSRKLDKLEAENKELRQELARLKENKKTNSKNSSLPPSNDKESKNKSNARRNAIRKKNGKKRGGQPGHKKHDRAMVPLEQVSHVVSCHAASHCTCGKATKRSTDFRRHQKHEFPIIKPEVTEYQIHTSFCEDCDKTYAGKLPEGVSWSMLGPRATAMTAHLSGTYRISKQNIVGIYNDVFGLSISTGMVCKTEKVVSQSIEAPVEELKEYVQSAESEIGVHADETGFKERGKKMWAWVAVSCLVAVFIIRKGRSKKIAKELLGGNFSGILCSDRYSAYSWISPEQRQICWAHLERDFRKISERSGTSKLIGDELLIQTNKLFHQWHQYKDKVITRQYLNRRTKAIRLKIETLLWRGTRSRNKKTAGTCRNILSYRDSLWRFIKTENIEPTNNLAEQVIRTLVIWRKTSFGTQSPHGSLYMERIMSVVATCRLQKKNTLEYLTAAVRAHISKTEFPSLIPITEKEQPIPLAA